CVCGNKFLIGDEQLSGHVICPACKRALSPVVTPAPEAAKAVPASAAVTTAEGATMTEQEPTKRCPFCGEVILAIARKCKHCGEFLDRAPADPLTAGGTGQAGQAASAPASLTGADVPPVFELTISQWDNFWRFLICAVLAVGVSFVLIKFELLRPYAAIGVP